MKIFFEFFWPTLRHIHQQQKTPRKRGDEENPDTHYHPPERRDGPTCRRRTLRSPNRPFLYLHEWLPILRNSNLHQSRCRGIRLPKKSHLPILPGKQLPGKRTLIPSLTLSKPYPPSFVSTLTPDLYHSKALLRPEFLPFSSMVFIYSGRFRSETALIPLFTRPKETFLFQRGLFFSRQNHRS